MGRSGNLKDSQPKAIGSTLVVPDAQANHFQHCEPGDSANRYCRVDWISCQCARNEFDAGFDGSAVKIQEGYLVENWSEKLSEICPCWGILNWSWLKGNSMLIIRKKLFTDLEAIERAISDANGRFNAVVSCVSCFAPRAPDSVVQSATFALNIPSHTSLMPRTEAPAHVPVIYWTTRYQMGRIDAVVMSLDKNFLGTGGWRHRFGPNHRNWRRDETVRWTRQHFISLIYLLRWLTGTKWFGTNETWSNWMFDYFKKRLEEETAD